MTFKTRLAENASVVQTALEQELDAQMQASGPAQLVSAMKHAVLNGGKRFRPFLVIETAKLFSIPATSAVPTAMALECIHCYSLVHDDLPAMDDDDLRRGQPTVHIAFDEATAILTGDALLTSAFEVITRPHPNIQPATQAKLVHALAIAAGSAGMVGGQMLDLQAEAEKEHAMDAITRIQSMKTGALIRFACEAGAILGNASAPQSEALVTYAENIGLAFQLADDLLDAEGSVEKMGKAIGKDKDAGKATFVDLLGAEATRTKMQTLVTDACEALALFSDQADTLKAAATFVIDRDH